MNGAVLIAQGDKVLFEKAMGYRGSPTLHSQFLIGSISKQITAVLVLRAVEKNLLDLHVPLKNYLSGITHEWGNVKRHTSSNPSGGLISTAHDLLKWNQALYGGKLFGSKTYQAMMTPSAQREHRWGTVGYGYGVHINPEGGISEISHNGIISGYLSTLNYYPHNKISIIILENQVLWTEKWDIET